MRRLASSRMLRRERMEEGLGARGQGSGARGRGSGARDPGCKDWGSVGSRCLRGVYQLVEKGDWLRTEKRKHPRNNGREVPVPLFQHGVDAGFGGSAVVFFIAAVLQCQPRLRLVVTHNARCLAPEGPSIIAQRFHRWVPRSTRTNLSRRDN